MSAMKRALKIFLLVCFINYDKYWHPSFCILYHENENSLFQWLCYYLELRQQNKHNLCGLPFSQTLVVKLKIQIKTNKD